MTTDASGPYGDGVRFSISIHQFDETGFDADAPRDYLKRAEELGFEGGWVLEQIIGEATLLAPLELLAWAAGCTERLRLGVAVLVSSLHDPLQPPARHPAVVMCGGARRAAAAGSPPSGWTTPPSSVVSPRACS